METVIPVAESPYQSLNSTEQTDIELVGLTLQEEVDRFNQWIAYRIELEPIMSK